MSSATTRAATSGALAGIGALHVAWGLGSTWPFANETELTDNVVGAGVVPSPRACFAVAGLLGIASALVAGAPTRASRIGMLGRLTVATVLATRGALGLTGHTDLVSPGSLSPRFRSNDRKLFAPLCLLLAAGAANSLRG